MTSSTQLSTPCPTPRTGCGPARPRHLRAVPNAGREDREPATGATTDEAFTDFVRTNTPALLRSAVALTGSRAAAEELVQGTLVRLYPQWTRVQQAEVPLAYVRRALSNRHHTEWQRSSRHEVLTPTVPEHHNTPSAEHDLAERDEMRQRLQQLGARQRAAIVLRYYEGLDDREIAEALGCRIGTVRSLISRGLATLRLAADPLGRP